ncbi:hypothetical protein PTNB85_06719 [Pyrenophora teres f. teres]|nr:hypothetical protein PTNB85_06719 [Pyrenophora teres f. teres]KAE8837064.1 hypothetical protein HRS9122_07219 [Pyrenophora teres f. teres]KAE8855989.1 hypothetical protein PTNB29_08828 [Pyrenophora teres f. teres]
MPSLFSSWNRGRTKGGTQGVDGGMTEDVPKEGESLLIPYGEQNGSLRLHRTGAKSSAHLVIWVIVAVLSAMAVFYLGFVWGNARREGPWGSFERGFVEERVVTPSDIFQLTQRVFSGGVDFNSMGEEILGPSDYTGYVPLSTLPKSVEKGITTGLLSRGAISRDVHCIDHLRQVIQCQGTSVISPSEWHPRRGQYINPKQLHTCRDFTKLHEFSKARYNGSIAIPRGPKVPISHAT